MKAERLNILAQEITAWANTNFTVHRPHLGIIEEIGEAAHCILKRAQGIRGFDNPVKFKAELTDAIADIAIYTLNYAGLNGYLPLLDVSVSMDMNEDDVLAEMSMSVASLIMRSGRAQYYLVCLLDQCATLADQHEIDFEEALESTWARVSKRDWVANPVNAALMP